MLCYCCKQKNTFEQKPFGSYLKPFFCVCNSKRATWRTFVTEIIFWINDEIPWSKRPHKKFHFEKKIFKYLKSTTIINEFETLSASSAHVSSIFGLFIVIGTEQQQIAQHPLPTEYFVRQCSMFVLFFLRNIY